MPVYASIEPLVWESQFFGRNSARLCFEGGQTLDEAQLQHFDVVQAKVPCQRTDLLDMLSLMGFRLVEGEADLSLVITTTERQSGISIARTSQIPALRAAASEAFVGSRFRSPWYQAAESASFYAQWIENAVRGTFDNQCLLAIDEHGAVQGFVSLRELPEGEARIGLLAVLPAAQGHGIGTRLMRAAADWCNAHRLSHLRVATQLSNLAAMRLYLRSGATLTSTAYWLYR